MKLFIMKFSPFTSTLFGPNILLSTLFSNSPSLCSSLNVRDQVTHPYRTTGKIIVSYILIFKFFDSNREDRRFRTEFWKLLNTSFATTSFRVHAWSMKETVCKYKGHIQICWMTNRIQLIKGGPAGWKFSKMATNIYATEFCKGSWNLTTLKRYIMHIPDKRNVYTTPQKYFFCFWYWFLYSQSKLLGLVRSEELCKLKKLIHHIMSRSQWPRGLGHELSSPAPTLRPWVRIPLEAWMFVYSVCVYSVST
jgi:hypothetical protein